MELGELVKQKMMQIDIDQLRSTNAEQAERIKQLEEIERNLQRQFETAIDQRNIARQRIEQLNAALLEGVELLNWYYDINADSDASKTIAKINEILGSE